MPKNYGVDRSTGLQPGWAVGSIGYHADDGGIFIETGMHTQRGPVCNVGDKMGCGMKKQEESEQYIIYFTKNGQEV